MNLQQEITIIKFIDLHFDFLLSAGFRLSNINIGTMSSWTVFLKSDEFIIKLRSDRGEIFLAISPVEEECWFSLTVVIFFITKENELIESYVGNFFLETENQIIRLSKLLKKYLADVNIIFGNNFIEYKNELLVLSKKANQLQLQRFRRKSELPD